MKRMKRSFFLTLVIIMMSVCTVASAGYQHVYGTTKARIRVRDEANMNAVVFDNIKEDRCVWISDSQQSGNKTFVKVRYRTAEGKIGEGWVVQMEGRKEYVHILTPAEAMATYEVSSGNLPTKVAGVKTAAEREAMRNGTAAVKPAADNAAATDSAAKVETGDASIRKMQEGLKKLKLYTGDITGNAGNKTVAAIRAFQKKYGLTVTGNADMATLAKLDEVLSGTVNSQKAETVAESSVVTADENAVRKMQEGLKKLNLYSGNITGNAGSKTVAAIRAFQKKYDLPLTGRADEATLKELETQLAAKEEEKKESGSSDAVRTMQEGLKKLGLYGGDITGNAGSKTVAAIKEFQKKYGLTVTGAADAATMLRLNAVLTDILEGKAEVNPAEDAGENPVRTMQEGLKKLGLYGGDITGNAGKKTVASIKAFQKKYGLVVTGAADAATLLKLNAVLSGSGEEKKEEAAVVAAPTPEDIRTMQEGLKKLGLYGGNITGNAGSKTVAAIRSFQKNHDLVMTGIADAATLAKLEEVLSDREGEKEESNESMDQAVMRKVQENLRTLGYYKGQITGNAGSKTVAAIKAFQKKSDIPATGVLNTDTLSLIGEAMEALEAKNTETAEIPATVEVGSFRNGDQNETIAEMQQALTILGFYKGKVTGHFGNGTETAVKKFQKAYGLRQDGVLGTQTITEIREAVIKKNSIGTQNSSAVPAAERIYNLDWFAAKNGGVLSRIGLVRRAQATLKDLQTGISFQVYIQSTGYHLDVEPFTVEDTERMLKAYGAKQTTDISYRRRPMLLTTNKGYRLVCSIYGQPHGNHDIKNNNFPGQFCLHFLNSRTSGSNNVDGDHQAAIQRAINLVGKDKVVILQSAADLK